MDPKKLELAREVVQGKWGNGDARKAKLKAAGYDPAEIQAIVNELLKSKDANVSYELKKKEAVAREVVQGKWGNGEERKAKLKAAGYDPAEIQKLVNSMMKK